MAEQQKVDQGSVATAGAEPSPLDALLGKVDLEPTGKESQQFSFALKQFLDTITSFDSKVEKIDRMLVDKAIASIDLKISNQVNEILHCAEYQQLESAWGGLNFLVKRTNFRRNIKLEIIQISKEELKDDFDDAMDLMQSGLFKHLYEQEYDQPGGEPIAAVIGNYEFNNTGPDLSLLRNLSKVSAGCHAPFIGSVGADFFNLESIEKLPLLPDVEPVFDNIKFSKWREFRKSEDSRYVGLTIPRFLLREPYSPETVPCKTFHFIEDASGATHDNYLWGNASWAFATTLVNSFADNGWCVNIRGPQSGGMIEDLPLHFYEAAGETTVKIPTEVLISDRREFELSELGFIPLSFYKSKDYACFFSAHSAQKPIKYTGKDGVDATANSRLSARLPYLFLVSRLAHYLKVIQRENIGAAKERDDLQIELEEWINTLVTEMKDPGPELKARCPLSQAQITVQDIADNPGFYNVDMMVRPHFQIEGIDVNLSLVSRLPKAKE